MAIEPHDPKSLVAETGGAVLGALIGMCFAGPMGAGAGALVGTVVTPLMERWFARCVDEFRRRGDVIADAAAAASGLGQDEVVERLLSEDVPQPLVARVLDAAARTDSAALLRLLGAILGEHVTDRPRRVDEDSMLVDCIDGLEAGHLRVLQIMETQADPDNPDVHWMAGTVAQVAGDQLSAVGLRSAIGGLLGRGLIETVSGGFGNGGSVYAITEFGRALLDALRWSSGAVSEF